MFRRAALFFLPFFVLACGSMTHSHVLIGAPRAPSVAPVRVFFDTQGTPAHGTKLATVTAKGTGDAATVADLVDGLVVEAQAVGATGVVQIHVERVDGTLEAQGIAVDLYGH